MRVTLYREPNREARRGFAERPAARQGSSQFIKSLSEFYTGRPFRPNTSLQVSGNTGYSGADHSIQTEDDSKRGYGVKRDSKYHGQKDHAGQKLKRRQKRSQESGARKSSPRRSSKSSTPGRIRLFFLIMIPLLALSFFGGYLVHKSLSPKKAETPRKSQVAAVKPKPALPVEIKEPDYDNKEYAYVPAPEIAPPEKPAIPTPELPPPTPSLKKVCIILDDFGYNYNKEVKQVLDLSPAINVAILPEQEYSRQIMEYAHKTGHDVIIHAPFQGGNGSTEPKYIHQGDSRERVDELLSEWFHQLPNAIGINNHQGSVATSDRDTMDYVVKYLKDHNKIFVDSMTSPNSKGHRVARAQQLPHAKRTAPFLDNEDDHDKINSYVHRWLAQAVGRSDRVPVTIGHITKKNTRRVLIELVPKLHEMGYELVPISEVLEPRPARQPAVQVLGAAKKE